MAVLELVFRPGVTTQVEIDDDNLLFCATGGALPAGTEIPDQVSVVEEALALTNNQRVRHLPVMEDGALLGVVSQGDLVKAVISEKEFVIEQLLTYITTGG